MCMYKRTILSNSPTPNTCQLLGPVSLLIQFLMGTLVVSVLLIKRQYEHPRRKLVVWGYDTAKQIGGALGIHFINLGFSILKDRRRRRIRGIGMMSGGSNNNPLFSMLVSLFTTVIGQGQRPEPEDDQCDWFFLNLLMDTTVGIPVLWLNLRITEIVLRYFGVSNIESGNYFACDEGDTEEIDVEDESGGTPFVHGKHRKLLFSAFFKQFSIFMFGLLATKSVVFLMLTEFEGVAVWFANLVLGWADPWPDFQVFLVMFVSPILLNCFQYCCIDSIIKVHGTNFHIDSFEPQTLLPLPGVDNNGNDDDDDNNMTDVYGPTDGFGSRSDEYSKMLENLGSKKNGLTMYGSTN